MSGYNKNTDSGKKEKQMRNKRRGSLDGEKYMKERRIKKEMGKKEKEIKGESRETG